MNNIKEAIKFLYAQRSERYKVYQKHKDWKKEITAYDNFGDALRIIEEYIENTKNQKYTEEKIKEEWKSFGFTSEKYTRNGVEYLNFNRENKVNNYTEAISFNLNNRTYDASRIYSTFNHAISLNPDLHILVDKTLKWLEWI